MTLINRGAGNVDLPAPYFSFTNDPIAALKALLLHGEIPHGYRTINGQLCQGDATADQGASQWVQVQIYPELAIKADMALGYSKKEATVGATKLKFDASASATRSLRTLISDSGSRFDATTVNLPGAGPPVHRRRASSDAPGPSVGH